MDDDSGDAVAMSRFQERMADVARRAVLAEREACANIAAEVAHHLRGLPSEDDSYSKIKCDSGAEACERVATAIRNRSK